MSTWTPIESVWSPSLRTWMTRFLRSGWPSVRTTLPEAEIFFSLASWTPVPGVGLAVAVGDAVAVGETVGVAVAVAVAVGEAVAVRVAVAVGEAVAVVVAVG